MTKIKMPESVAWVRRHPDGALTAEFLEEAVISPVRKQSGAWLPMITTVQAEAYADARVREALEEAVDAIQRAWHESQYVFPLPKQIDEIRALIPKEPPCDT